VGRFVLALGVLGAIWASPVARPSAQVSQKPVFRAGTDYVQLDVVVTDGHDKAIRDLTKDDFEIAEHGRPQPVADFAFVSIPPVHRTVTEVTTTAPTIDVVTNTHSPIGRQWVLVIDDLHIIELHLRQTKQVVQEFLESLPPEDQVAIVFVGRSDLSQGFTSDLGAEMRTVNRIKDSLGLAYDAADVGGSTISAPLSEGAGAPNKPTQATTAAKGDDIAVSSRMDPAERDRYRYALSTVEVLKNISASLVHSTYPRKALVYVSEGMTYSLDNVFHSDYLDFSVAVSHAREVNDQLRATFEAARRGGVPVYAIDPRGLPDCNSVRGDCTFPPKVWENIRAQMNNMRTLAENTGGLAFVGNSDLTRAVHDLVEDNSSFYVLGYYPQPFERDGKFHDVKVTVKRPGARVRARAGYEAPKSAPPTAVETTRTLDDALGSALPVSGLSLRAFAASVAPGLHGMKTVVTVEVTYPAPLDGSPINDSLQFGMLALDHDGKVKGSTRHAFHFTGSLKGAAEVTYAINDVIELPSQPLVLRVAVASQALGKSGSIHVPVEPLSLSRDDLQGGPVVIGLAGPTRQAAVPPGALSDLVPFQPTTTRTFAATDVLRVFVPVFWGSRDDTAQATLSVKGASSLIPQVLTLARSKAPNARYEATLDTTLSLAGLQAGKYLLAIDVRLSSGQTARRMIAFEVQ
jgi:VWFA-related protein